MEEISQDERKKIREEERMKVIGREEIIKDMEVGKESKGLRE